MTAVALRPQEWHEVTAPPPHLAQDAGEIMAHCGDGTLATPELGTLVESIAARPDLWEPLLVRDPHRRRYRLLFEDDRIDIWVLSWMHGQATGFHDHGASKVALTALRGSVLEQQILVGRAPLRRVLRPGSVQLGPAGYIHSVRHASGSPAATLHAYSPPLIAVGQYRAGLAGELLREQQHGRRELLDNTIDAMSA